MSFPRKRESIQMDPRVKPEDDKAYSRLRPAKAGLRSNNNLELEGRSGKQLMQLIGYYKVPDPKVKLFIKYESAFSGSLNFGYIIFSNS